MASLRFKVPAKIRPNADNKWWAPMTCFEPILASRTMSRPLALIEGTIALFAVGITGNRRAGDLHVELATDGFDEVVIVVGGEKKASRTTYDPSEIVGGEVRLFIQDRKAVDGDAGPVRVGSGMRRRFALIGTPVARDVNHPTFAFDAVRLD